MADTLQYVSWHLAVTCPFRRGDAVSDVHAAHAATERLRDINHAIAKDDVYDGGVCVTSASYFQGKSAPWSGFRMNDAVAAAGGLADAQALCGRCPANASADPAAEMAGCCGWLHFDPNDAELERALRGNLNDHDLNAAFGRAFARTTPLWYGLWIDSPLSPAQLELLPRILPERLPTRPDLDRGVALLCRACERAVEYRLGLYVELPPPGHTDLGWYTTFPHCPRCRCGSGHRWKDVDPARRVTCRACGHGYAPALTASSKQDDVDWDSRRLEAFLPAAEYEALADEWLRRHGPDPLGFTKILEEANARRDGSLLRRVWRWLRR
jgi:hypothetical protein